MVQHPNIRASLPGRALLGRQDWHSRQSHSARASATSTDRHRLGDHNEGFSPWSTIITAASDRDRARLRRLHIRAGSELATGQGDAIGSERSQSDFSQADLADLGGGIRVDGSRDQQTLLSIQWFTSWMGLHRKRLAATRVRRALLCPNMRLRSAGLTPRRSLPFLVSASRGA
jgi:hypothetical protein